MTALLAPPPGRQTQERPRLRPVPGQRRRMSTVPFVLVVTIVLALGMVALLVLTTALQNQAFGVQRAQRDANALAIRLSSLQSDVADARSVQSLAVAAQHLGMRPNPYEAQIRLPDGVVIGQPRVVLGGEVPTVRYLTPDQAAAQVRALDKAEAERKAKVIAAAKAKAEAQAKAKAVAKAKAKAKAEAAKAAAAAEAQAKADAAAAKAKAGKKGSRP